MSIRDVIKKSVLESDMYNQAISLSTILTMTVDLLLALVMGLLIYAVYKKFYKGVVFSRNYAITLVGMTVLTSMVTLAISTNIVISLGMVGALSIVRYRTAIKEPLDLMYMFWAITTGITIGASMYILAVTLIKYCPGSNKTSAIYSVTYRLSALTTGFSKL
jgi:ABC-type Fe3+ transport system permease subunit